MRWLDEWHQCAIFQWCKLGIHNIKQSTILRYTSGHDLFIDYIDTLLFCNCLREAMWLSSYCKYSWWIVMKNERSCEGLNDSWMWCTNCGCKLNLVSHGLLRLHIVEPQTIWTQHMMTSWNGNIFPVTGPLCGEFTGHWWFETPARSLWRHSNDAQIYHYHNINKLTFEKIIYL